MFALSAVPTPRPAAVSSIALALPQVSLTVAGCKALDNAEIRRLLATELVDAASLTEPDVPQGNTRASLQCEAEGVVVRVDDALTNKVVTRRVRLAGVEDKARARVLSIAVAELLRASWLELSAAPVAPAPAREEPTPSPRQRGARFSIGVGPAAQAFSNGAGPLVGGLLLGRAEPRPFWPLETGLALLASSEAIRGGRARVLLGHAQFGAGFRLLTTPVDLSGLVATRFGWVAAKGEPSDLTRAVARDVLLPWMGIGGGLSASFAHAPAFLALRLEAGYTLASVTGKVDAARELNLAGAFVVGSLLVGLGR